MENFGKTTSRIAGTTYRDMFFKFKLSCPVFGFAGKNFNSFVSERTPSAFLRINLLELMYRFNVL